jgi:hypothetical protein
MPMPLDDPAADVSAASAFTGRRFAMLAGAALIAAVAWGAWRRQGRQSASLLGRWSARIGGLDGTNLRGSETLELRIETDEPGLRLTSQPLDIEHSPDWQTYRDSWKQRTGSNLKQVVYSGEGKVLSDDEAANNEQASATPRSPQAIGARRVVFSIRVDAPEHEGEAVDTGALRGVIESGDQHIRGSLWLNSEQAERIVDLRRKE